jgi:hypothetical protein
MKTLIGAGFAAASVLAALLGGCADNVAFGTMTLDEAQAHGIDGCSALLWRPGSYRNPEAGPYVFADAIDRAVIKIDGEIVELALTGEPPRGREVEVGLPTGREYASADGAVRAREDLRITAMAPGEGSELWSVAGVVVVTIGGGEQTMQVEGQEGC